MVEKFMITITAIAFSFMMYCVFIWMPVKLYVESECLKMGHTKHYVTVVLERYCVTKSGVVIPISENK